MNLKSIIEETGREFDIKFDHFNGSETGKRICDGICENSYDLEDVKSFLRTSQLRLIDEIVRDVEGRIKCGTDYPVKGLGIKKNSEIVKAVRNNLLTSLKEARKEIEPLQE